MEVCMPDHPVRQKTQTQDELLRMVPVMQNNDDNIRKATQVVLK
jgi:hypothetical protein